MKPIALYYLNLLPDIKTVAKGLGYAIGLHGSLSRDLDLIAVPWVENAVSAEDLVEAIRKLVDGLIGVNRVDDPDKGMTRKPHGRKSWSIHLPYQSDLYKMAGGVAYIDLSIMPIKSEALYEGSEL